jgi:hypothetical protein
MCLNCEREEMWAAYQEHVARRAAAKARAAGGEIDNKDAAAGKPADSASPNDSAWAAGTWFEIKTQRDA